MTKSYSIPIFARGEIIDDPEMTYAGRFGT